MNEKPNQFTQAEMQAALALHIWKNDHLRDEIMKNPKATIERELNVKFDDEVKVDVVNHTQPNQVTFVLPYNIHKGVGHELSDDQLEEVAGGFNFKQAARSAAKNIPWKKAGGELGNLAGEGIIQGAKAGGVTLPSTGLGREIGSAIGGGIGKQFGQR